MTERLARFWLSQADLPSQTARKILDHYESALAFYVERQKAGPLLGKPWEILRRWQRERDLQEALNTLENEGVSFLTPEDHVWPEQLNALADPPLGIYAMGDLNLLSRPKIFGIVGTRHCSHYGRRMARAIARDLAVAGVTVLSGFAVGIDTAAHEGCLEGTGCTVAVMGCGLDVDYPSGSSGLKNKILETGGLIFTEHPMGSRPLAAHFPQRNRMIAALSKGLVMVEGTLRSGAMISAHLTAEQGGEVFALPGAVEASLSSGPHSLIREGARLITCGEDILQDMGWDAPDKPPARELQGIQAQIVHLVEKEPLSFDQLVHHTGWSAEKLNACLFTMCLEGLIEKSPGQIYSRKI